MPQTPNLPPAQHNPETLTGNDGGGREEAFLLRWERDGERRRESCGLSFERDLSTSTGRPSTSNNFLMAPNLALLRPPLWGWGMDFPRRKETCGIFGPSQIASESVGRARHTCFSVYGGAATGQNPTQVVGECWMITDFTSK